MVIIILSILLNSCGVKRVYTSASYGSLKSYTEKLIYNGKKETATYVSGSLSNIKHPQDNESDDSVIAGDFSIYRTTTDKGFNYYYGLGAGFGTYKFKSDLTHSDNAINYFNKNEQLNFYNFKLKTGVNLTKTWKKIEYSIIGAEFMYVNEFGSYIDALNNLPEISEVVVVAKKSIFAFNFNSEITFKINKDNNIGFGVFLGNVLFLNKQKLQNENAVYSGFSLKYTHKNFTISLINEHSASLINSTQFGITYKLFNQSKSIKK